MIKKYHEGSILSFFQKRKEFKYLEYDEKVRIMKHSCILEIKKLNFVPQEILNSKIYCFVINGSFSVETGAGEFMVFKKNYSFSKTELNTISSKIKMMAKENSRILCIAYETLIEETKIRKWNNFNLSLYTLNKHRLFGRLKRQSLIGLSSHFKYHSYMPHQVLYRPSDFQNELTLVLKGGLIYVNFIKIRQKILE